MRDRVVWAIARRNPPKGPTCRWVSEKKVYGYKNFCVYFTHLPGSPPWRDLHEILLEGSSRRHNQPCQILSQSDQGFWFCGGSNFWLSHKKEKLPLTQGLNYRSACDITAEPKMCCPRLFDVARARPLIKDCFFNFYKLRKNFKTWKICVFCMLQIQITSYIWFYVVIEISE